MEKTFDSTGLIILIALGFGIGHVIYRIIRKQGFSLKASLFFSFFVVSIIQLILLVIATGYFLIFNSFPEIIPIDIIKIALFTSIFFTFAFIKDTYDDGFSGKSKKEKEIKEIIEALDSDCYKFLNKYGRRPIEFNNFDTEEESKDMKNASTKLIALGILKMSTQSYPKGEWEYAYRFSDLGFKVIKEMQIHVMTKGEFEKSDDYKLFQQRHVDWLKFRERILK